MTDHIVDANKMVPPPHLLKKFSEQARVDSKKRGHSGYCKTFAKLCIDWALNSQPSAALAEPEPLAPAITPVGATESGITELFYRHMGEGSEVGFENAIAEALARWGSHPTPIPVAERWPEFSECDPQERVWAWNPFLDHWKLSRINRSVHTHWLPANALPVPAND